MSEEEKRIEGINKINILLKILLSLIDNNKDKD